MTLRKLAILCVCVNAFCLEMAWNDGGSSGSSPTFFRRPPPRWPASRVLKMTSLLQCSSRSRTSARQENYCPAAPKGICRIPLNGLMARCLRPIPSLSYRTKPPPSFIAPSAAAALAEILRVDPLFQPALLTHVLLLELLYKIVNQRNV